MVSLSVAAMQGGTYSKLPRSKPTKPEHFHSIDTPIIFDRDWSRIAGGDIRQLQELCGVQPEDQERAADACEVPEMRKRASELSTSNGARRQPQHRWHSYHRNTKHPYIQCCHPDR